VLGRDGGREMFILNLQPCPLNGAKAQLGMTGAR
jgi:hypothetical protein